MELWQQRVIDEKNELIRKVKRLNKFILTDDFEELSAAEKELLRRQHKLMMEYKLILNERIKRFDARA